MMQFRVFWKIQNQRAAKNIHMIQKFPFVFIHNSRQLNGDLDRIMHSDKETYT